MGAYGAAFAAGQAVEALRNVKLLLEVMYRMRLLTPAGIWRLLAAIRRHGVNIAALLRLAERKYCDAEAIACEGESVTYRQLLSETVRLSCLLRDRFRLGTGMKVGLVGRNGTAMVRTVFAVSSTGADLYLLSAELSPSQLARLSEEHSLDLLLYERGMSFPPDFKASAGFRLACLPELIHDARLMAEEPEPSRAASGRLMLLTGGTTGRSKGVAHKPSLLHYLPPFAALLQRLPLKSCRSVYIATPIAHGYGISHLLMFIALGYKIVLSPRFEAGEACRLILQHRIEAATVVPLMLHRMLREDPEALRSLRCIASGGAELTPALASDTLDRLGDILYNLYGTTEGGLTTIATPQDLLESPGTIGRAIKGILLHVLNEQGGDEEPGAVGRLCIRGGNRRFWRAEEWVETGDLGRLEPNGLYRLSGRIDDRIVSGGYNVYPAEVEQTIVSHPDVEAAAAVGMADERFGQRLILFVQPVRNAELSEAELMEWLRPRLARYQLPREIVFRDEFPYTALGKLDKKMLK